MSDQRLIALGERIRGIRKAKGLSQEKLASLSNIERAYMGKIERGESSPPITKLFDIAEALQINISELMNF